MSTPEQRTGSSATIHASYGGFSIDLHTSDKTIGQLEALITTLLDRGWQPAPSGAMPATTGTNGTNGKGKRPAWLNEEPLYDDRGRECCPKHRKPLSEGRYGLYCACKDAEEGNDKGYCRYQVKADAD